MKDLLKQVSEKAIALADFDFTKSQIDEKWLGYPPASEDEIKDVEKKLEIQLPTDYKYFLAITNGFSAPNDIEPSLNSVQKIDFLKNIDNQIIEAYNIEGIKDIGQSLEKSILVGGIKEEQYFLLIPPKSKSEKWKYWKFANWIPGEEEYEGLEDYFTQVLEFMEDQI